MAYLGWRRFQKESSRGTVPAIITTRRLKRADKNELVAKHAWLLKPVPMLAKRIHNTKINDRKVATDRVNMNRRSEVYLVTLMARVPCRRKRPPILCWLLVVRRDNRCILCHQRANDSRKAKRQESSILPSIGCVAQHQVKVPSYQF